MSRDVTHIEAVELLAEAALDALPPDEQAGVIAHAAGCPECGPALTAYRDAIAQLAFATPTVAVDAVRSARVRTRLMARARADLAVADRSADGAQRGGETDSGSATGFATSGSRPPGSPPPAHPMPRVVRPASGTRAPRRSWVASPALGWGIAIAAGIIGVLAVQRRATIDGEQLAVERAQLLSRVQALRDSVDSRDAFVRAVTGKQISSMQLTSGAVRAPWAWMFWDHATNRWTLVARDLPAPAAGRTYQLWLVTPRAKISAGTFTPRPDGAAEVQATYALSADSLSAIAVTDEPAGGVTQPTGTLVISATANRPGK